jgi:hypothetical protein
VKALQLKQTKGMTEADIKPLSLKMHSEIEHALMNDPKQHSLQAIEVWKKYSA